MSHSRPIHYYAFAALLSLATVASSSPAMASENTWQSTYDLGVKARRAAKYSEAEQLLKVALTGAEASGRENDRVARTLNELATVLRLANKLDEAKPLCERALRIAEAAQGKNGLEVASSLYGLATIASGQGRADDAEPLFKRALAIREAVFGPASPEVARCLYGYARFKMNEQDFGQARGLLTRALAIFEMTPGDERQYLALTLVSIGSLYEQQNKATEASEAFKRAVQEGELVLPAQHPALAWIKATHAQFKLFVQQDAAGAIRILEEAIPVLASAEFANLPQVAALKADLAEAYVSQQRFVEAERMYSEAFSVLEGVTNKDDPMFKEVQARYEELRTYNAAQANLASTKYETKYETKYVNGTMFQVATQGELQVWMACWKGSELQALLYVVNGSDRAVTFFPERVRLEAVKKDGQRMPQKTFSAEQYERKVTNANTFKAFAIAMGRSGANTPQPQTTSTSGQYRVTDGYGSATSGSYYGTITRWPTQADYAEAEARNRARTEVMLSQLSTSFEAMAARLMRTHTLEPYSFYGGVVYMNHSGKNYSMTVPFDGKDFAFTFAFE